MDNIKEQSKQTQIPEYLKLTETQINSLREDLKNKIKISDKKGNLPIMKISVQYLREIMGIEPSQSTDNLIFFLASYRSDEDVARYNKKAGTSWGKKDLQDCPTILVSLEKAGLITEDFYDVATIKPPPEED
jgi:hypothetical protein